MLTKKLRFHGHGSLRFLYKNADAHRSRFFTVKAISNPHRKTSRFSVVVSKKVHKSAVGRNRIRRRIYEALRQELPNIVEHQDVAIIVTSSEVIVMPYAELTESLRDLLTQAGLLGVANPS